VVNDKYSSCIGIIKYRITDIIYSEDENIKNGDEFYLLTANTSRGWYGGAIQQNLNDEYILFAGTGNENPESPIRFFYSTTKYFLISPFAGVMTITDDGVKFDGHYSTLANKARTSTRATYMNYSSDCYVMNEQDFISELKKLIQLYKQPESTLVPTIEPTIEPSVEPMPPWETGAPPETPAPVETEEAPVVTAITKEPTETP
jgi:hypothetical protein